MLEKQEEQERRRAKRVLKQGGDNDMLDLDSAPAVEEPVKTDGVLNDPRFAKIFEDPEFEIDEQTHEFQMLNPSTKIPKGLTVAEQEDLESRKGSSDEDASDSENDRVRPTNKSQDKEDKSRISSSAYKKAGHRSQRMGPEMVVSSSNQRKAGPTKDRTFGSRVSKLKERRPKENSGTTTVVGEREITFAPERKQKKRPEGDGERQDRRKQGDRRNASNNVFRNM
jgi:ribosome biogenesis protein ENP2